MARRATPVASRRRLVPDELYHRTASGAGKTALAAPEVVREESAEQAEREPLTPCADFATPPRLAPIFLQEALPFGRTALAGADRKSPPAPLPYDEKWPQHRIKSHP